MNKITIVAAALAAMATGFLLASWLSDDAPPQPPAFQGMLLQPPRAIALPELVKHDGSALTAADLRGHWTLVFFGYTNCPDICPATMSVLAAAKQQSEGDFPQVMLVSVDPERDSPEMLGEYVQYFDPDFIGVTGTQKMLEALTLQMNVVFGKAPSEGDSADNYLVDHSSSVLLIDPDGALAARLRSPHTPASILDSVEKITK